MGKLGGRCLEATLIEGWARELTMEWRAEVVGRAASQDAQLASGREPFSTMNVFAESSLLSTCMQEPRRGEGSKSLQTADSMRKERG